MRSNAAAHPSPSSTVTALTRPSVTYLRSSKDRSDVSIDAQRRELQAFAQSKNLTIAAEFADIVVSGKGDNRAGFQRLLAELKAPRRTWSAILMFDTSRLSRNQHVAHVFRHECKKRGVAVHFAMTPEVDGVAGIILPAVLHAMDEVHSFLSREKGLAGMAENVRRGFRAGGRAPAGYQLLHIDTGAVREGRAVMKSRLEPGPNAERISAYLRDRAIGTRRSIAARKHGLALAAGTLIGIEWNALTYAGHTVWNVSESRMPGGYQKSTKRRPREDWQIQRDTHAALITELEAETILARMGQGDHRRRTGAAYLLTGMLETPAGAPWYGDGGQFYRAGKGRRISATDVDGALVAKVVEHLHAGDFVAGLLRDAKRQAQNHAPAEHLEAMRAKLRTLTARIQRASEAAVEAPAPRPFYEMVNTLEVERSQLEHAMQTLERENMERLVLSTLTERDIVKTLDRLAESLQAFDRERLKDFLHEFIERIVLNPEDLTCRIQYRIPALHGNSVASPTRPEIIPYLRAWRQLKVA